MLISCRPDHWLWMKIIFFTVTTGRTVTMAKQRSVFDERKDGKINIIVSLFILRVTASTTTTALQLKEPNNIIYIIVFYYETFQL